MYKYCESAEKKLSYFKNRKEGGCLLLTGDKGLGKASAAKQLVAEILQKDVDYLTSSPDYFYAGSDGQIITVDAIRPLKVFSSYVACEAPMKICIIDNANLMTEEAQNLMLKTLEEDTLGNLYILIAHEPMIETVRSRSFVIPFLPLGREEMREIYPAESELIIALADGHPGRVNALKHGELCEDMEQIMQCFQSGNKRELLECYHLLREKDKDNFFEKHDIEDVRSSIKVVEEIFVRTLIGKQGEFEKNVRRQYKEEEMLNIIQHLQDASFVMKRKGQFNKNSFFDLIAMMAQ